MGYPVEIKVNVAGPVQDALAALHLDGGSEHRIWFLEDVTPGLDPALPLLSAGIILRVRSGKFDDSTVKLRPCRRTQLTPEWVEAFEDDGKFEYRVEEDWSGERRCLAASAVRELDPGLVAAAETDPGALFGKKQRNFLGDCADLRINLDAVVPVGPIRATKWKTSPSETATPTSNGGKPATSTSSNSRSGPNPTPNNTSNASRQLSPPWDYRSTTTRHPRHAASWPSSPAPSHRPGATTDFPNDNGGRNLERAV
jgi:hypothetical protein